MELNHRGFHPMAFGGAKPGMRKVRTHKHHVSWLEIFNDIPDKSLPIPLMDGSQLKLRVMMKGSFEGLAPNASANEG